MVNLNMARYGIFIPHHNIRGEFKPGGVIIGVRKIDQTSYGIFPPAVQLLIQQSPFEHILINSPVETNKATQVCRRRSPVVQYYTSGKNNRAQLVRSKSKYPFNFCSFHKFKFRTYCRFTPGVILCRVFFVIQFLYI